MNDSGHFAKDSPILNPKSTRLLLRGLGRDEICPCVQIDGWNSNHNYESMNCFRRHPYNLTMTGCPECKCFIVFPKQKSPFKHDWLVVEPTPLKNIFSKWEIFPKFRGEHKKSLNPQTRWSVFLKHAGISGSCLCQTSGIFRRWVGHGENGHLSEAPWRVAGWSTRPQKIT